MERIESRWLNLSVVQIALAENNVQVHFTNGHTGYYLSLEVMVNYIGLAA